MYYVLTAKNIVLFITSKYQKTIEREIKCLMTLGRLWVPEKNKVICHSEIKRDVHCQIMWKMEVGVEDLCYISFKLHLCYRCFIQRDSWDGNRSIQVVTGLSIAAGVFVFLLLRREQRKNTWVQKAEWLFLKIVSVFMRLSENLRLLIIWMLLPQETYICSQQRAPVWNHTAAGTGWTPALERQEEVF